MDVECIISHWHSGAKIIEFNNTYTLMEQQPGEKCGVARKKIQISSNAAQAIIEALKLSRKEYPELNATLYN